MSVPWGFSEPAEGEWGVPNLPTHEGRLLGAQLARLTDIEEARLRKQFPRMHRRCGDCALRLGTVPNGCPETLMDVVKAVVEHVPFYCHRAVTEEGEPRLLCAGYAALVNCDPPATQSSPPQTPLDSTGSRCGDPGTTAESPSGRGLILGLAQSASSPPMGPVTQTPAVDCSPCGGGRRDPSTSR